MYSAFLSQTLDRSCRRSPSLFAFCVLMVLLPAVILPVSAGFHTVGSADPLPAAAGPAPSLDGVVSPTPPAASVSIGPSESLQAAIDAAADGDTIILDPGIYHEHGLNISKALFITANASAGGDRNNTIIDAEAQDRIFNVTSGITVLYFDNLTFRNGHVTGDGGAISMPYGGFLIVTSSTFENCSATSGAGGAVYARTSIALIGTSLFTRCSVEGNYQEANSGGAVYSGTGFMGIVSSSFTDCSAPESFGGAVESPSQLIVLDSVFTRCSAIDGGALDLYTSASVISSVFTDCSASAAGPYSGSGGAIWSTGTGTVEIVSSTFTGCTATFGGGAVSDWMGSISSLAFHSCTFSGCSADSGGAVRNYDSSVSVTSSTITGCSATGGSAVHTDSDLAMIGFNRIYGNTLPAVYNSALSPVPATDNWWGTNTVPASSARNATISPWLVLGIAATPDAITTRQNAAIRTNLSWTSDGTDTTGGGIFVPEGIPNRYAVTAGTGVVVPATSFTTEGVAQATFLPRGSGTSTVSGTVDDQTVFVTLTVEDAAPITTLDTRDLDDGGPSSPIPSSSSRQSSDLPLMTVTVNIGGNGAAAKTTVTGTQLSGLIVTGTLQNGPGANLTAPPGTVYQYLDLVPARYASISNAVINFTVPQTWVDENHIAPGSIVLYHQTANGWVALPTTLLFTKDGTGYYSAQTTGFSLFAIAGAPAVLTPPGSAAVQEPATTPLQVTMPAPAATRAPVTTQTTVPPAATPKPSAPSPLLNIVLVIAAIGILASGGFLVRRWWYRRQNPALFEEF